MGTRIERRDDGVVILTVEHPPVNALPVDGWFALADAVRESGADPHTRVVVLRAEGRGFNAGVDIKELAAAEDHSTLVAVNHGCYAAFAGVYDCPVPVISAVHGFCVGGGIGLVGNSDVVVQVRILPRKRLENASYVALCIKCMYSLTSQSRRRTVMSRIIELYR